MVRMIIADDEPVISRGLSILVDWESLGIEITDVCEDGNQAMEAILRDKPQLALMDISMPGMTGIDILKRIRELCLSTKVILISGFQEFSYARSAVAYGAVDYLLKPVIKDELLAAVEKALGIRDDMAGVAEGMQDREELDVGLGWQEEQDEKTMWLPVLAELLPLQAGSVQEQKLMDFAWRSFLEDYMAQESRGIMYSTPSGGQMLYFHENGHTAAAAAERMLEALAKEAGTHVRGVPAFIVEESISSLGDAKKAADACAARRGELFFTLKPEVCVILMPHTAEDRASGEMSVAELERRRIRLIDHMLALKTDQLEQDFEQFSLSLARAAGGRKDDASYYFCSTVRLVEDRLHESGIACEESDMKQLLEMSRSSTSYAQMKERFLQYLQRYPEIVRKKASETERKDILQIKDYIERRYRDNLTLEVMAGEFYMNPYYFSAWFKKQTGKGFKEYVSYVRIQHAISLLLTTNMKTYEIAAEVGFSDVRSFTEAFSRQYQETPGAYRKRVLSGG